MCGWSCCIGVIVFKRNDSNRQHLSIVLSCTCQSNELDNSEDVWCIEVHVLSFYIASKLNYK